VHREYPRVRKAGAELVFVGNGNRHFARAFRDELGIKAPIYVDTQRGAYAALGMRRGFGATVGSLAAVKNAARALRKGFRQGSVPPPQPDRRRPPSGGGHPRRNLSGARVTLRAVGVPHTHDGLHSRRTPAAIAACS